MNTEPMDFDLAPIRIPVTVRGKRYILSDATAGAVVQYRNALMKSTRMIDGKVSGVEGMADAEPLLVSLCLSNLSKDDPLAPATDPGGNPVPVGIAVVKSFPSSAMKILFDRIKEISGLNDDESEETLAKRIEVDQKKLASMRAGGEPSPKAE